MMTPTHTLSSARHLLQAKVSRFAVYGVIIAMTCILVATLLSAYLADGNININSMLHAHRANFALWMLDLMPFLFAFWGQYTSSIMAYEAGAAIIDQTSHMRAQADAMEYKATYASTHDALTGLPNRALILDLMQQVFNNAIQNEQLFAILIMDLDHFKEINDTLGHHNGDLLLKQVAERLESHLRDSDAVGRLGGDEFAILLPKIKASEDAERIAQKLLHALESPFSIHGLNLEVNASIGIAVYPVHGDNVDTLLQRADVAMYAAKRARSGYGQYCPHRDEHSMRRLTLTGELRQSIDDGDLVLHYQPKLNCSTGRICGAEALVRWQHPEHGLMFPDEFIQLAERTGLIKPLTQWVLEQAFMDCSLWNRQGLEAGVAVNISAQVLMDPFLPDTCAKLLRTYAVEPAWVVLEITESTIMADKERALDVLLRLEEMGLCLSIDDFGTGYSSLSYLKQLPVSEIKIDKSFVMDMLQDENDEMIVRATVDLAHNLNLSVVAEGVQDRATWRHLVELGCDAMQGKYAGMPAGTVDLIRLGIREHNLPHLVKTTA